MGNIQNITGKSFEDQIMEWFYGRGYWCKKMNGIGGTVFDIIVMGDGLSFALEAKHVSKGNKLTYTRELQKKTDELNRYNDMTHNLYLVIGFGDDIRFSEWGVALECFKAQGYIAREECIPIEGIECYNTNTPRHCASCDACLCKGKTCL